MLQEREDIGQEVREIITGHIRREGVVLKDEDRLSDLGIESLDFIEVIFSLEEAFKIDIPFNANTVADEELNTVGDIVDRVYEAVRNAD